MVTDAEAQKPQTEADPLLKQADKVNNKPNGSSQPGSMWQDMKDTTKLAVPIFFAMLSFAGKKTTDTAFLGHVSTDALSAASLSDVWTMCTSVLLEVRVLDSLIGPAIGAGDHKMAGVHLQVALVVHGIVSVLTFIGWNLTGVIWIAFGVDKEIAKMAGYYARILSLSLPGQLLFALKSQFFTSLRIMNPEVVASNIGMIVNILVGYIVIFGVPFTNWKGFGFDACPIVTVFAVYLELFIFWFVAVYQYRLHDPAWDGWNWTEVTRERILAYWALYWPAAFGLASDFWRFAVVGAVAAKLGELEVAVYNTGYRIMWLALVVVGALSTAAGISVTQRLGAMDFVGSKRAARVGVKMSIALLIVLGMITIGNIRVIGSIFSDSDEFLDLLEDVKVPFAATMVLMNMSVSLERIPFSIGRTKEVFWAGFIANWVIQVPAVILLTTFWRADLTGLYCGMSIGYLSLNALHVFIVLSSDWQKQAELARLRSIHKIQIKGK